MRASHHIGACLRSLTITAITLAVVLFVPLSALATWDQFQGGGSHQGVSDGPEAPLAVAWSRDDFEISDAGVAGGLSQPVVADDGTIVVVVPHEVLGLSGDDGSETFSAERDLGPSAQPAIGQGSDGPIVVFTEGFGDDPPVASGSATPSPSPAAQDDDFDSHVNAVDLGTGEPAWASAIPLQDIVQTPVAVDRSAAYVGDVGGHVTAIELSSGDVRWTADLGTSIAGAITLDGERAYVATLGGQQEPGDVVALDASTGDEVWRSGEEAILGNLVSSPVLADGRIVVLEPGFVVMLDAADGRLRWRTEIINPRSTPFAAQGLGSMAPVSAEGQVFAVDVTGRVYALDAETGTELWDHALNDVSQLSPPVLTAGQVLVPTDAGVLFAIDRRTGHLVFRVDSGGSLLRGLADSGDVLIGVTGNEDAGIVAFGPDPGGALIDEPSPTTVQVGRLLAGFVLGALPVAIVAMTLARPLRRRLVPVSAAEVDIDEDDG